MLPLPPRPVARSLVVPSASLSSASMTAPTKPSLQTPPKPSANLQSGLRAGTSPPNTSNVDCCDLERDSHRRYVDDGGRDV
uniref:Putative secreted protein n=1 Tax=Ixodes ricinus TaxID=34613 RepID=A0A6B0TW39_IXORI